ncbi:hypothetical protein [Actomonas aquatica]|uniref:Uncharacterized protein n=1 Tax=Actomonas aquatica TaxID=2866162 RepID=A0ABZ1C1N8_9BACT|nr:hypothetical protein [Opitutus sp. WL0086]WRQ85527.1 hypothetical protein K1X11_012010 [Opitutus sp. WL0086]
MSFDPDSFFEVLSAKVRAQLPFVEAMDSMLSWCEDQMPHSDWSIVRALPLAADLSAAERWIPELLSSQPCPFGIRALYFGLAEMANDEDEEFADLYVGFLGQYDADDEESAWVFGDLRHYPEGASLPTDSLRIAGETFNREDGKGLGNEGNYMFCMAYSALLVASIMSSQTYQALNPDIDRVGMLVGWDSGDLMKPGDLSADGFIPRQEAMI